MNSIIAQAKTHCLQLLKESRCKHLAFHNTQHTIDVFSGAKKIGQYEGLTSKELEIVQLAALFHDTGNVDCFQGHENVSAQKAFDYLSEKGLAKEEIQKIVACILATKMPQNPQNKLQKVLCDADLAHLGAKDFLQKNKQLRKEWSNQLNLSFSTIEWLELNCNFLKTHRYFTSYGKKILEPQKKRNFVKIKQQMLNPTKEFPV